MATQSDTAFHRGETWVFRGSIHDETGAAMDITGATVTLRIEEANFVADAIDAAAGTWEAVVIPDDQAPFTSALLNFEVRAEFASGTVSVQNYGQIKVLTSLFVPA